VKALGFSNAYVLALPAWGYHYPGPMFQRKLFVKQLWPPNSRVHSNKAVAQGAVAFFLDAFVTSRMSRFKYGIRMTVTYNPYNVQHAERSSQATFMADGIKRLPNAFSTILDEVRLQVHPLAPRPYRVLGHSGFRDAGISKGFFSILEITTEPQPN